jgi:hypothetical protein
MPGRFLTQHGRNPVKPRMQQGDCIRRSDMPMETCEVPLSREPKSSLLYV